MMRLSSSPDFLAGVRGFVRFVMVGQDERASCAVHNLSHTRDPSGLERRTEPEELVASKRAQARIEARIAEPICRSDLRGTRISGTRRENNRLVHLGQDILSSEQMPQSACSRATKK